MNTIIRKETKKLSIELISYIEFAFKVSEESIKSLELNDNSIAMECLEKESTSKIKMDIIFDESMYILTQHPLGKELRRVISYMSISKLIHTLIHNSIKVAKFQIKSEEKLGTSSIKRIKKTYKIFRTTIELLIQNINEKVSAKSEIMKIVSKYPDVKEVLEFIRRDLQKSLASKNHISEIRERLLTFSICEAVKRNTEKVILIAEYLLFIEDGKNHSYIK